MVLLRKAGHWRGQRYQWSRPHDRSRAQIRRLRQIVNGQLEVDYATRLQAQDLILQVIASTRSSHMRVPD
jgi:hypothetical protein